MVFKFKHCNLEEFVYLRDKTKIYLPSRENFNLRGLFSLDDLKWISDNLYNIYPTTSSNLRIKSNDTVEFYTRGNESQFIYFRQLGKEDFIFLHKCDLDEIIRQQEEYEVSHE